MHYYEQLYDIDFYSNNCYIAMAGNSSITIRKPGIPDWSTWHGTVLTADDAKQIWLDFKGKKMIFISSHLFQETLLQDDRLLLVLILCEDAYRIHDRTPFFLLNRILIVSGIEGLRLKAIKLHYAWFALSCLTNCNSLPLDFIVNHSLRYIHNELRMDSITKNDFKVEEPVKREWKRLNVSHNDREAVEAFYKTTASYIVELTAANHQVETLFNYCVVLETIKRLGVRNVIDYGAGIGTFLLLAYHYGIKATYMDLQSVTMRYSLERFRSLGIEVPFMVIEPHKESIPNNTECIVCTEVLEHIFEPEELVKRFYNSLLQHGIIVVSESFDYVDRFCAHLPQHKGKGSEIFLSYLKGIGFRQIHIGFSIHPSVHIKM